MIFFSLYVLTTKLGTALGSLFFCLVILRSRPSRIDLFPNQTYRDGRCIGLLSVLLWHLNTSQNGSLVGKFIPSSLQFNSFELLPFKVAILLGSQNIVLAIFSSTSNSGQLYNNYCPHFETLLNILCFSGFYIHLQHTSPAILCQK